MRIYNLFPIANWEIFEYLCLDLWNNILDDYTVKKFGRRGQKQKGLDITCKLNNEIIGIQCKCVKDLDTDDIEKELENLEELNIELTEYIIATTYPTDAILDEYVMKKSQDNEHPFEITIYFWEDIVNELSKDENLSLIKKYYPKYSYDDSQMSKILNHGIKQFNKGNYKSAEACLNTIKDSIDTLSKKNNYELNLLEGKYLELCKKYNEAGKKYIEAYEHSSKDIKSKYYYALGLFYTDNLKESKDICDEILTEEPLNQYAYTILILINKLEVEIPQELTNCPEINYNLGLYYYSNKEYDASYKLFKKSNLKTPIKLLNCANNRLILFKKNQDFPFNISQENHEKILKIENILQKVFDGFSDDILSYYLDTFPNLLSLNKFNHNLKLLNHNVERVLNIDSENKYALYYKAVLLENQGHNNEALDILKDIPNVLDSFTLITKILMKENKHHQIIEYGEEVIGDFESDSEQYLICQDILFNTYMELDKLGEAEDLLKDVKNNFRRNLYKSKLCGVYSKKLNYLLQCCSEMDNAFSMDKIGLAVEFSKIGCYNKAISVYESLVNIEVYSPVLDDLAFCYLKNKDYCELINLCENHIHKEKPSKHLIEFEIEAYLEINDFENAITLMNIYSDNFELNYAMKIAKAQIQFFNKEYDKVDDFLKEHHDFTLLRPDQCLKIYSLYKLMKWEEYELFEILFKIRTLHKEDLSVHEAYLAEFLNKRIEFINPIEVDYDVGVLLNVDNIPQLVYVTKNYKDLSKFNQFELIIGHKKGNIIKLENNIKLEIIDIYHKFNYAFKESLEFIKFNNSKYIKFFNFESTEESIEKIKEHTLNRHNNLNDLEKHYSKNLFPLIFFSRQSRLDMYDSYFSLKSKGLKSFSLNENNHCPIQQKLVLDSTSLMTIHLLNIENFLIENYSIQISTSEYFLLKEIQEETRLMLNQDNLVGFIDDGEFHVSNNDYSGKYNFISNIINWIDKNCEIVKSKALFELDSDDKNKLDKLPFSNIKENILLAFNDCILVSDDLDLKKIINKFFDVKTCGTLSIIQDLLIKKIISKNDFEDLVLKLYEFNFRDVKITTEMLVKALKQSNYNILVKFLFDFSINLSKYSHINWNTIIKCLNMNNINDRIIFEMIKKIISNAIFITYCNPLLIKLSDLDNETYIAGNNSKKFHKKDCTFAKKISSENIVQFDSKKDALEKGYVACKKCIDI